MRPICGFVGPLTLFIATLAGGQTAPNQLSMGTITGTVLDQTGAVSSGAKVRLTVNGDLASREVLSGNNGQFSFSGVLSGPFRLAITLTGFSTQVISGNLRAGETYIVPPIVLTVATVTTEVHVGLEPIEVARAEVKEAEHQRLLGIIPNFYVTYHADAVPLTTKLKFELAWRSSVDPFTFAGVGVLAGFQQASDDFSGYGQGASGYAKRLGASYADVLSGTFIGSALLPSLFKQDPRYFYKGTGSIRSRILYAMGSSVICKGDNKRWQPNYSGILGSFVSGGISYLYYPNSDRHGAGVMLQNSLLRIAESSFSGIFQEFIARKLVKRPLARNSTIPKNSVGAPAASNP